MDFGIGGVYEVALLGRFNDAIEMRNIFHLQKVDGGTIPQEEGLEDITEFLEAVLAIVKALQSTLMIWRGFTVSRLEGDPGVVEEMFSSPIAGEVSTDALPPGVAFLTYMNTGEPRRQLRKYWPGLTEGAVGPFGGFSSTTVSDMADLSALLLNDFSGTNGDWRYGHYNSDLSPQFVFPTTFVATAVPAYQRRRRQGRGI